MQTINGTEYQIGKTETGNLVIQIGEEMAEITQLEISDAETDNININYTMTENFPEQLIIEVMSDILSQEGMAEQLKFEPVEVNTDAEQIENV